MQGDIWQIVEGWAEAVLLYPGVLFAVAVVLAGEWLASAMRPLFSPRLYRAQARPFSILQPLYTFAKLLRRQPAARWQRSTDISASSSHTSETVVSVLGAIAPLLALALLPVGGSPISAPGDIVTFLLLLAVYPISSALSQLREGGLEAMRGARDLGRLLVVLFPAFLLVAALVQVAGTNTLSLASLTGAPLTAQQTLVRLVAGVALLLLLPWWAGLGRGRESHETSAGAYAGHLLQMAALSAFWAVIVLPAPGETAWAVAVFVVGTLFAYVSTSIIAERWATARREGESAALLWASTLPAAALALVLAFWVGA